MLEDGVLATPVTESLQQAATLISTHRLGTVEQVTFVRCAHAEDYDWPPRNRHCPGLIELNDDQTEDGEWTCSQCDRIVRPFAHRQPKRTFTGLRARVNRDGVLAFLDAFLGRCRRPLEKPETGVWRLRDERTAEEVHVVCGDLLAPTSRWRLRDVAAVHAVRYLTIRAESATRYLPDAWAQPIALSALVLNEVTPNTLLANLPRPIGGTQPPTHASLPVFSPGPAPIVPASPHGRGKDRCFIVEFRGDELLVDGVSALAPQASALLAIIRLLWEQFLDDVSAHRPPSAFAFTSVAEMAKRLGAGDREARDPEVVRRSVNRLQDTLVTVLRRERGAHIERDDLVETAPKADAEGPATGYRINPLRVAIRAPGHWTALK